MMGARWIVLCLAPVCLAWNGSGVGEVRWSADAHVGGELIDVDAVVSSREERLEVLMVLSLGAISGDGVLTLHLDHFLQGRGPVSVPRPGALIRLREYSSEGDTLFRGLTIEHGQVGLESQGRGLLSLTFDVTMRDGLQHRRVSGALLLKPFELEPDDAEYRDDPDYDAYHYEGGCWGSSYDEDDDDYWGEDDGSDSGCAGDDLDDDGPSGSSGCEGDNVDSGSDSDSGGCEGDNVDSEGGDSCDGCAGDDLDAVACVRGGGGCGGGPGDRWTARLVGWLPWMMVFACLRLMRRRRAGA